MNPGLVEEYLATELQAGCIVGLFQNLTSRENGGLSSPDGSSINDGIATELCSMSYISVDMAVDHILQLGRFTKLAKVDVQHTFRMSWSAQTTDRCSA